MKKNILSVLLGIMLLCNNFIVVKATGINEDLPSKYDLRDVNGRSYVTPARNQGRAGSCWAFAAMGSLESAIMKKNGGVPIKNDEEKHKGIDFIDLSEDHMDRNHGYDYNPKQGGRYECAVSYLNSRKGPYLEKDFPFGKVNSDGTYELPEKKEVTNEQIPYFVQGIQFIENVDVHTFNDEKSMLDKIKATKKAIMDYGAVSTNIYQAHDGKGTFPYTNDKYYNEATFAYYCDGKDGKYNKITNHAISIIGWDDNFSRENFKTKPKYNGAWICKEEQGDSFGDNGFYYVSYESVCVTTTQYCFKDVVKSEEGFNGIAQHETLGLTGFKGNDFSASDGSDTYFNVFTAKEDCTLEAVGFYSMGNNSKYKVYVIDNFKNFSNEFDGDKSFSEIGNKYLNTSGTISNAGYNTIKLSKSLNIKKGQEYAIGLWMDNSDNFSWMNVDNKDNDYVFETKKDVNPGSKKAKINNNETYVYDEEGMFNMDGDTCALIDTSTLVSSGMFKEIGNLCLKAYYNTKSNSVKDETIKEEAKINGTIDSKTNWYKSEITINAPDGYEISKDGVKWDKVIKTIDDGDYSKNGFPYYLKRLSDNVISKEMKIKFKKDVQKPIIGELSYSENKSFLDWILGKKNLEIKVPVTDDVSGAKEIKYTIKSQDGTEESKSEIVKDGNAKISIDGSFKGSVTITAEDNAGNISENKIVGVKEKGIIVDNLAPIITIEDPKKTIDNIGYDEKVTLPISVVDVDKNNKITSGLKSISYSIDNEKKVNISIDKSDNEFVKEKNFEVEINKQGQHTITVDTEDNAGNTSTQSKIVKIYNEPKVSLKQNSDIVYDGKPIEESIDFILDKGDSKGSTTYEYREKSQPDSEYVNGLPTKVGTYVIKAKLAKDNSNCYKEAQAITEITIKKAIPKYEVPKGLKAYVGDVIKDIKLPEGFKWQVDENTRLNNVGNNTYKVYYNPDEENYIQVNDIEVMLNVQPTPTIPQKPNQTPTPVYPKPNPNPNPAPTQEDNDNKGEKWDKVVYDINNSSEKTDVKVEMKEEKIPKKVFESIKGKDVNITLNMGQDMKWTINGRDVVNDNLSDINLFVKQNTNDIPKNVVNELIKDEDFKELSIVHDGELGFKGTLTVNMKPANFGKYANLFYYNRQSEKMEFKQCKQIEKDGNVNYVFNHASEYIVMISEQPYEENKESAYNLKRLGGIDRYSTALKIAEDINSEKLDNVVLASAANFPDALGGSILASKYNAPILLVDKYEENNKETIAYIKEKLKKDGNIYLLGGPAVVPEGIISSLKSEGYNNFKRLGGKDRYETNLLINNELNIKKGTDVIVSSSKDFADSLSISSVAGIKQMPIYITSTDKIKDETLNAIKKISPNNIYITGGIGAVSNNVENKLKGIGNVIRLGGKDRYETSINIAKYFRQDTTKAVIANGLQFPDSLTGSVLAAKNNAPIILVGEEVSKQKEYLDSTNIKDICILGGTGVISEELVKNLNTIKNKK